MDAPICSIAMAADGNCKLLLNTLRSFRERGYGPGVEVIIADDGMLTGEDISSMADCPFRVRVIHPRHDKGRSDGHFALLNAALREAKGGVILIQEADCMHLDNVVERAVGQCGAGSYLAFVTYFEEGSGGAGRAAGGPRAYQHCCAITARNLRSLKGFDEKYSRGVGYEREEFLYRVHEGKLRVQLVDDCATLRQRGTDSRPEGRGGALVNRNRLLYERYTKRGHGRAAYLEFLVSYSAERLLGRDIGLYGCYIDLLLRCGRVIAALRDRPIKMFRYLYQSWVEPLVSRNTDLDRIPIVINNRNRLTMLKGLIDWLVASGMKDIHILDNDSTYGPLLAYYSEIESRHLAVIHRLGRNAGPYALWQTSLYRRLRWKYYVYSDSDVLPCSADGIGAMRAFMDLLGKHPWAEKAGFGIRLDDIPDSCPRKSLVLEIEGQYWLEPVGAGAYVAPIDTTFALYRPFRSGGDGLKAIRTGEPYVVRHLPWYVDPLRKSEEESFYEKNANSYSSYIQLK